jgi:membrane protein YqaA with SNARE-associated domain
LATLPYKDKNGGRRMRKKMMKRKKKKKKKSWKEQEQPLHLLTCWLHPVPPIPVFS